MRHVYQIVGGVAVLVGIFFGTQAYLDARDSRAEKIAVKTFEGYDKKIQKQTRDIQVQTQIRIIELYQDHVKYSKTPQERESYERKIDQRMKKIEELSK